MKTLCATFVALICGCAATQSSNSGNVPVEIEQVVISGNTNLPSGPACVDDPAKIKEIRTLIRKIRASRFRKPMVSFDPERIKSLTISVDNNNYTMAMRRLVDSDKMHGDRFYGSRDKNHEQLWELAVGHLK